MYGEWLEVGNHGIQEPVKRVLSRCLGGSGHCRSVKQD